MRTIARDVSMFGLLSTATVLLAVLPLAWGCREAAPGAAPDAAAATQDTAAAGSPEGGAVLASLPGKAGAAPADRVERGRYLVRSIGCGDCHSPKLMTPQGPAEDETRMLSGHPAGEVLPTPPAVGAAWVAATSSSFTAWAGPWGISYAANLTPDENTGLGIWTEDMFLRTIRTGRHMGQSRPLLPPMPWQQYSNLTDDDLKAIYAYLRTLPPVHNRVPEPVPPAGAEQAAPAGG